jgi:hypothetical protein
MAQSVRSMALCACSSTVLIAGICGSASPVYQPAFVSWNHGRTRSPCAAPTVVAMRAAKWRRRWPNATTRRLVRCRHRWRRTWTFDRSPWRTEAETPSSLAGSLWSAWRRQQPRRARGTRVRILRTVLSQPSGRAPRPWDDGSCARAARCNAPEDSVKAAALVDAREPSCQRTRPLTMVGKETRSVRQRLCCSSARLSVGNGTPPRVRTVSQRCWPKAQSTR